MGTGSSANPTIGVPPNPRISYTKDLSKKEKKDLRIDAPVLVDVQHGSIRYRYGGDEKKSEDFNIKDSEKPFEGKEKINKQHYFYHARLDNFSEDAKPDKEDSSKFIYVAKGPIRAQQKKLYYVYGRGWNAVDGLRKFPTESCESGKDYSWPTEARIPNDVYYDISFTQQDADIESSEEERLISDLSSTANKSSIQLTLSDTDTAADVKRRIAVKILKPMDNIHVCVERKSLRDEDVVGDFRREGHWSRFHVVLNSF